MTESLLAFRFFLCYPRTVLPQQLLFIGRLYERQQGFFPLAVAKRVEAFAVPEYFVIHVDRHAAARDHHGSGELLARGIRDIQHIVIGRREQRGYPDNARRVIDPFFFRKNGPEQLRKRTVSEAVHLVQDDIKIQKPYFYGGVFLYVRAQREQTDRHIGDKTSVTPGFLDYRAFIEGGMHKTVVPHVGRDYQQDLFHYSSPR